MKVTCSRDLTFIERYNNVDILTRMVFYQLVANMLTFNCIDHFLDVKFTLIKRFLSLFFWLFPQSTSRKVGTKKQG